MLPKWKIPKGKYVLKLKKKNAYVWKAGSYDDGKGRSEPCVDTTMRMLDAYGFETARQAEAMRKRVKEQYGLETVVVERNVRRYD